MVSALMFGESQRRTTSASSDTDQSGAYVASVLDTALRNAGADLMQSLAPFSVGVLGCNPGFAAATSSQAPFNQFLGGNLGSLRVAPVLIDANPTGADPASDILAVMSGSGAAGGIPRTVNSASGATLLLPNTIGIAVNSLVLINQPGSSSGACAIQTVTAVDAGGNTLTLNAAPTGSPSIVLPLGDPSEAQFQLFGVDPASATFASFDLRANTARPMASNVLAMQALYGVAGGTGQLAQWVSPTASGYDIQSLMADPDKIKQIVAVRIALILRSNLYEKEAVPTQLSWFNPADGTSNDLAGIPFNTDGLTVPQKWSPAAGTADEH
jgi:type IV pilus assembly protein PilW